mgnify:CR=1 FL=1
MKLVFLNQIWYKSPDHLKTASTWRCLKGIIFSTKTQIASLTKNPKKKIENRKNLLK